MSWILSLALNVVLASHVDNHAPLVMTYRFSSMPKTTIVLTQDPCPEAFRELKDRSGLLWRYANQVRGPLRIEACWSVDPSNNVVYVVTRDGNHSTYLMTLFVPGLDPTRI